MDDSFWRKRRERERRDGNAHQLSNLGEGAKENSSVSLCDNVKATEEERSCSECSLTCPGPGMQMNPPKLGQGRAGLRQLVCTEGRVMRERLAQRQIELQWKKDGSRADSRSSSWIGARGIVRLEGPLYFYFSLDEKTF